MFIFGTSLYFKEFNMNFDKFEKACLTLLGIAGILVLGYAITNDKRIELKELEIKKTLPTEYFLAEAKESEASSKAKELDHALRMAEIDKSERLTIDKRNREDAARIQRMEFEKTAPAGYWALRAEEERSKAEIEIAKHESNAMVKTAQENRKAAETTAHEQRKIQQSIADQQNKLIDKLSDY